MSLSKLMGEDVPSRVIARPIDEDGNYHDDEGIYRDGQTHVEIVCSGCVVCNTRNPPPFWYSGCAHCVIKGATGTGRRYEVVE